MTIQSINLSKLRPLHLFDGELGSLHSLLLEMTDLLMYQIEQTLHALDFGDIELALKVIARDRKVDFYQTRIEHEVRSVLSRRGTAPNDLRLVMLISKMTHALEKLGNEIADLSSQIKTLFDHNHSNNHELMTEIIKIGGMIKIMLDKMIVVLETRNSNQAYKVIQTGWKCDTQLQLALKHHLSEVQLDSAAIEYTLNIMHILKFLERCANLCRNISEYQILMLDSIDIRKHVSPANFSASLAS